ncbi:hypothetical protein PLANPX_5664 [Lacipirellula parvula]|uniref:Uncharacterized protein n=1 Tax=Lacipirellula parvula TaxID=2650471 RepID=A0A5K7XIV9_9BACT|nr:hypothetical protein PLANPX_5664 [Lacipirellula parvula]
MSAVPSWFTHPRISLANLGVLGGCLTCFQSLQFQSAY